MINHVNQLYIHIKLYVFKGFSAQNDDGIPQICEPDRPGTLVNLGIFNENKGGIEARKRYVL